MHKILFPLNDTIVVFLHQDDTETAVPHAVQITVKTDRSASGPSTLRKSFVKDLNVYRPHAIDTITRFYLVRHDLSVCMRLYCQIASTITYQISHATTQDLILRLVTTHTEKPVQDDLIFEGIRYTLHARE